MTKTTGQRLVEECLSQMGTTKIAAEYPETVSYLSRRFDQVLETANAEVARMRVALTTIDKGFYSHKLTIREAQRIIREALAKKG
jgi:hypothetical protein